MPGIQESVLTNFTAGETPLLLFYSDRSDGDYLSVLLSYHLKFPGQMHERPVNANSNYFSNHNVRQALHHHAEQSGYDLSASLKLALDEGFDTHSLFGLALPVSVLQHIGIKENFSNAYCILIYNAWVAAETGSVKDTAFSRAFIENNEFQTIVINANFLISYPKALLHFLATKLQAVIIKEDDLLPHSALQPEILFIKEKKQLSAEDKSWFIAHDHLAPLLNIKKGNDFLFIFYLNDVIRRELLLEKICGLLSVFPEPAALLIVCKTAKEMDSIKILSQEADSSLIKISTEVLTTTFAERLNQIIPPAGANYICIDLLTTRYDFAGYIQLIQQDQAQIAYPTTAVARDVQSVSLNDLLTNAVPDSGMLFDKQLWQHTVGFDTSLYPAYIFWDFSITALAKHDVRCRAIAAEIVSDKLQSKKPETGEFSAGYKQVIRKHHDLIVQSLDEIIEQVSTVSMSSIQQRKNLQEKIASLQVILSHSKEELRSFQHLTAQLHHRIGQLENNWYHKLKKKIGRVKKIFFKKKSPGTGTLKRILLFIRFSMSKAGLGILRKIIKNVLKKIYLMAENRPVQIVYLDEKNNEPIYTYHDWILSKLDEKRQFNYYHDRLAGMIQTPLISIIMPVYNTPLKYLKEAIESVISQHYAHWELCIADDNSSENKVKKILHTYSVKDPRVRIFYCNENGHISKASNAALAIATGSYMLFMDHDDLLSPNCLAEVALAIEKDPEADIIYSDEDKIDERGIHQSPHFKPDWAPDHLLSRNYIGHVAIIKKSLMKQVGGFRVGLEGSQDYDLLLRATELSNKIIHIPKVLYHWRIHTMSAAQGEDVKPYAYIAAKKALADALLRRGLQGDVKYLSGLRGYKIDYQIKSADKVSIIIPTKDQTQLLKNTVDSILEKTKYTNYEIIILNNNSTTKQLSDYLESCTRKYPDIIRCVDAHFPFNFSKLMNTGASHARGKYFLLLNNDVEVIHEDWLGIMVSYAQQERIGAVGVKLLYPDDTIQHAGVVVGLGGIAGHTFVGAYKDEPGYFNYIQSVNNYSAVTAACLMVRKDAFEKVHGWDETFEVEYNDVDFCLKLSAAGYYNVYLPQVSLYHYESATRGHPHQSKFSYERHIREMKLFKKKWQHVIDRDPFYNPNLNTGVHDFSMNFRA